MLLPSIRSCIGYKSRQDTGFCRNGHALARGIWLLCEHADVQEKMRNEIREAQKNGQLSYDQLITLPYLDAVCRETLRV